MVYEWRRSPAHGDYDHNHGQNMIVSSSRTDTDPGRSSLPVIKFWIPKDVIVLSERI